MKSAAPEDFLEYSTPGAACSRREKLFLDEDKYTKFFFNVLLKCNKTTLFYIFVIKIAWIIKKNK